ncbi:hypothetical protein M0802_009616 [Mischocyttarus mexicanus]|nr:hypothetical protein M0802_009616 [Mischocyttarus mexicanus]
MILQSLRVDNDYIVFRMARSNYSTPEIFTNLDRLGCIQNADNIPTIYHVRRHCARKAICTDTENLPEGSWVYSTALADKDSSCCARLAKDYWWLQGDVKHMDEIRRGAKFKKIANTRAALRIRARRSARPE